MTRWPARSTHRDPPTLSPARPRPAHRHKAGATTPTDPPGPEWHTTTKPEATAPRGHGGLGPRGQHAERPSEHPRCEQGTSEPKPKAEGETPWTARHRRPPDRGVRGGSAPAASLPSAPASTPRASKAQPSRSRRRDATDGTKTGGRRTVGSAGARPPRPAFRATRRAPPVRAGYGRARRGRGAAGGTAPRPHAYVSGGTSDRTARHGRPSDRRTVHRRWTVAPLSTGPPSLLPRPYYPLTDGFHRPRATVMST